MCTGCKRESKAHSVYGYVRVREPHPRVRECSERRNSRTVSAFCETDLILCHGVRVPNDARVQPRGIPVQGGGDPGPGPTTRRILVDQASAPGVHGVRQHDGVTWARLVLAVFVTPGQITNHRSASARERGSSNAFKSKTQRFAGESSQVWSGSYSVGAHSRYSQEACRSPLPVSET